MAWQVFHPEQYTTQLAHKQQRLQQALAPFTQQPAQVYTSTPLHYRMRAEFRIWHQGDVCHYVMFEQKKPVKLEQFAIANRQINDLMPQLLAQVNQSRVLRHKLFQVEFLTTQSGQALISLIYHRRLAEEWEVAATELAQTLTVQLIGRSRGQRWVIGQDYVDECLQVQGRTYHYRQLENTFVQPNALVCEKMLTWAQQVSEGIGGDLLELYCGFGNFTLPLAQQFRQVLATEMAKPAIALALHNAQVNQVDNVRFVRLSSAEVSQALSGVRSFRRLEGVELADYDLRCVLVDPPRAGLDQETLAFVQQFEHIIYISCHLGSLADNLQSLEHSHSIQRLALFDQFPFTEHQETGVYLRRRAGE